MARTLPPPLPPDRLYAFRRTIAIDQLKAGAPIEVWSDLIGRYYHEYVSEPHVIKTVPMPERATLTDVKDPLDLGS